jgi:hypothetical protein
VLRHFFICPQAPATGTVDTGLHKMIFNFYVSQSTGEFTMRKLFLTIAILAAFAVSAELPICVEYNNEPQISCVAGEKQAVIISYHSDGSRSYEFYKNDRKIYMEYSQNYVFASDGRRKIELDSIPSDNMTAYVDELFFGLIEAIDF